MQKTDFTEAYGGQFVPSVRETVEEDFTLPEWFGLPNCVRLTPGGKGYLTGAMWALIKGWNHRHPAASRRFGD